MSINPANPLCNGYYPTGSSHIPEELVNDILQRLPVETLLRCRCVCKPWCSLIDSTTFVKNHLQRNIECNFDYGLISAAYPKRNKFYLVDVNSLNNVTAVKITNPLKTRISGATIVGSCNGLVCLLRNENEMLVWNPAMRKSRKLPTTNLHLPSTSFCSFVVGSEFVTGFGYDQLNDDYKVVRILDLTLNGVLEGVMLSVYSHKSNSWTQPKTLTYPILLFGSGKFVDGSLYWVALYNGSYIIVAFDLEVERFRELSFPAGFSMATDNVRSPMLTVINNRRLCLFIYPDSRTDLWLKNNGRVENSWSKVFPVEKPRILQDSRYFLPLPFSNIRNEILLKVNDNKLMCYDREKNEVENVTVHGLPAIYFPLFYTESLVQPSYDFKLEGKQLPKQSKRKKLKGQLKKRMSKLLCKVFKSARQCA